MKNQRGYIDLGGPALWRVVAVMVCVGLIASVVGAAAALYWILRDMWLGLLLGFVLGVALTLTALAVVLGWVWDGFGSLWK